jgi:hypothetical protein
LPEGFSHLLKRFSQLLERISQLLEREFSTPGIR